VYFSIYVRRQQKTCDVWLFIIRNGRNVNANRKTSYNKVTRHSNKTVNMIHINWCGRTIHSLTEAYMHLL